jgi:hypothetical protein
MMSTLRFLLTLVVLNPECSALQTNIPVVAILRRPESFRFGGMKSVVLPADNLQRPKSRLFMTADDDFWKQQKSLVQEMTVKADKSLRQEQSEKFAVRRNGLIGDTAFFTALICCALWGVFDNPFFSFSYLFGATLGLAYAYGLAKYVETIGGSIDDMETVSGSGVGQARFAFLILLVVFVGKFRSSGLLEIPSILGFFTYQLASLSQGLREIND